MTDLFEAAARRAQKGRGEKEQQYSMEDNALIRLLKAEREEKIRQAQEAERWQDLIVFAFDKTAELCGILGAPVDSVRYEDGIVWIRREKEAIRLPDVTIRDEADLRRACIKIIGSVCKA